ncbi:hypothetical protein [uncultured Pediococcus sp.]|uniref:hypothetical protein n=1 Tax=uncultured Pediococcus sp. TaxID=165192 RepID=UPI00259B23F0|nr:hypothetical protein [uncultured Pediococcus sp.]
MSGEVLADALRKNNSEYNLEFGTYLSVMSGCGLMFDTNAAVIKRELKDSVFVSKSCYPCNGAVDIERETLELFLERGEHKDVFAKIVEILEEYEDYPLLDEDFYYEQRDKLIEEEASSLIGDGVATEEERDTVEDWLFDNSHEIYGFLDYSTNDLQAYLKEYK